jgi:hypothetical protein
MNFDQYPGLQELLDEADAGIVDPHTIAAIALELAAIHSAVSKALEPLKERLREHAATELAPATSGVVTIPGFYSEYKGLDDHLVGMVTVTFPPKQVKVSKGADVDRLRRSLSTDVFGTYFETKTTFKPVKNFAGALKERLTAKGTETDQVLATVEYVEPTPRVGFKPTKEMHP